MIERTSLSESERWPRRIQKITNKPVTDQRSSALVFAVDEYLYVPRPDSRGALTAADDSAGDRRISRTSAAFLLAAVQVQHVPTRAIVTLTEETHLIKERDGTF